MTNQPAARRGAIALLVSLILAITSIACAQGEAGAADRAGATVYELSQSQVPLGEVGVAIARDEAGYRSTSYVSLDGLFDLADELLTNQDGAATSYRVAGSVQGIAVEILADFNDAGVALSIEQAGNTTSFQLNSAEPLYVLDNNFLDGFQVLASALLASGEESLDVAAVVPQAAALGRASIVKTGERASVFSDDRNVDASALDVTLTVRNQVIEGRIWVDADGEIVVFEQSIGAVRFERQSGVNPVAAAADGSERVPAGAEASSAGSVADSETAEEFLGRTAACVAVTKLSVESTGATLQGLLSLPVKGVTERGAPTLVLLPGSGAVDLRGNSAPLITNAGYEQLANALGCRGYGVLRIAKLGIAPSTGDGNAVTLDTYAENTAAWLALLAVTPGVDAGRLGVIGHSEGGLVALYATTAGVIEPKTLVLLATPGRPFGVLLREQILASARRGGADQAALDRLGAQVDDVLEAIEATTGVRLEPEGEMAERLADNPVVALFAHAAGLIRSEMEQDPAALLAELDLPVVIFQGGKDLQVLPVDGRTLAAASPTSLYLELPNLSHSLVEVSGPAVEGLVPRSDDVISQTLVDALATFLNGSLRLAR